MEQISNQFIQLTCKVRTESKVIMSLIEKIRERFAQTDLSKYTEFKALLQYKLKDNGTIAAVFGKTRFLDKYMILRSLNSQIILKLAIDTSAGKFIEGPVEGADATLTLEFTDYLALITNAVTLADLRDLVKQIALKINVSIWCNKLYAFINREKL